MLFLRACVVLCFLAASALEARAQDQPPPAAVPAPPTQTVLSEQVPATLMVWNRPLAVFRAPFGSNSPKQRADAASARIEAALDRLIPEEIRYTSAELGGERGILILGGSGRSSGFSRRTCPRTPRVRLTRLARRR